MQASSVAYEQTIHLAVQQSQAENLVDPNPGITEEGTPRQHNSQLGAMSLTRLSAISQNSFAFIRFKKTHTIQTLAALGWAHAQVSRHKVMPSKPPSLSSHK